MEELNVYYFIWFFVKKSYLELCFGVCIVFLVDRGEILFFDILSLRNIDDNLFILEVFEFIFILKVKLI